MKQVFYVHSGITWLIALGVIKVLSIEKKNVFILFGRGFVKQCEFEFYELTADEQKIAMIPSYGSWRVVRQVMTIYRLNAKICRFVGDEKFVIFLPSERNYLMQFLQTHINCMGRNFLEEGLLTYHDSFVKLKGPVVFGTRLRYFLRTPLHLNRTSVGRKPQPHLINDFTVYVCTDIACRMLAHHNVVKVDLSEVKDIAVSSQLAVKLLFVFDPVVEKQICDQQLFLKQLEHFAKERFKAGDEVMLKFHPQQTDFTPYLHVFSTLGLRVFVLPSDTVPEVLLLNVERLSVFGLCSSVLFYAKHWGHEVFSFSNVLAKESTSYSTWVQSSIPRSIIEDLKLL